MRIIPVIFLFGCVVSSPILSGSQALANACLNAGIFVTKAYLKEIPPNSPVLAGYLTIQNLGKDDVILMAIDAAFAEKSALHEMKISDSVMTMRKKEGGLRVPSGETIIFSSEGLHLMFMELKEPLMKGDEHIVTLNFSPCGTIDISMTVTADNMLKHKHHTHQNY